MTPLWYFPFLFMAGLSAGLVDSIAGGGGLITLPALLWVGLPPGQALGTNKLQSSFGSGSATFHYVKSGAVELRACTEGVLFTLVGAAAGALAVQHLRPDFLKDFIPWMLAAIAIYTLISPRMGDHEGPCRIPPRTFWAMAGLALGFYDGFFGPGTGSFWAVAIVLGLGYPLTRATGATKVMNFTSNVASLAMFALGGHIRLAEGLVMAAGEVLGAQVGSRLAIGKGARVIRPALVTVSLAVTAKLLFFR